MNLTVTTVEVEPLAFLSVDEMLYHSNNLIGRDMD